MRTKTLTFPSHPEFAALAKNLPFDPKDPAKAFAGLFSDLVKDASSQELLQKLSQKVRDLAVVDGSPCFLFKHEDPSGFHTLMTLNEPYKGDFSGLNAAVSWAVPEDYKALCRRMNGFSLTSFGTRNLPPAMFESGRWVVDQNFEHNFLGPENAAGTIEILYGAEFIGDWRAQLEEDDQQLPLNQDGDMLPIVDNNNSDYVCFHRKFINAHGDVGIVGWDHDVIGVRDRDATAQQGYVPFVLRSIAKDFGLIQGHSLDY